MTTEQLSINSLKTIWSALHFPNTPNHCGRKVLELFKTSAISPHQKMIFEDFEKNRDFNNAVTVLTEIENLFIGNVNLQNQVAAAMQIGANDAKIDMPPIDMTPDEFDYQPRANNDESVLTGGRIIGALFFFVGLYITVASGGSTIAYGAIICGLIKMANG